MQALVIILKTNFIKPNKYIVLNNCCSPYCNHYL